MFIEESLAAPVRDWVLDKDNRDALFVTPGSGTINVSGLPHCEMEDPKRMRRKLPIVPMFKIYQSILSHYNLPKTQPLDKEFGALISFSEEGHKVQPHKDPNPPGLTHVRFNVLINKPDGGGQAIINQEQIDTEQNEVWVCVAGAYEHSSVAVKGTKPRILLSYGTYLNYNKLNEILNETN